LKIQVLINSYDWRMHQETALQEIKKGVDTHLGTQSTGTFVVSVEGPGTGLDAMDSLGYLQSDYQGLCTRCNKAIYKFSGEPRAHVGCTSAR